MYLIKINFVEFIEVMENEITYHRRRFYGADEGEKDRSKKWWLNKYYKSLTYFTPKQLDIAFDRCRENYGSFPSVDQLLKFCPPKQRIKGDVNPDYTGPAPISPKMKEQLKHINSGPSRIKLSKNLMDSMEAMCRGRWGGDWNETFKRWNLENNRRL